MSPEHVRRGRSPGAAWTAVTRGAYRRVDAADPGYADLLAWQAVLPSAAAFTGLTATRILRWPTPPLPQRLPVFVAMNRDPAPQRLGLVVTRHEPPPRWTTRDGLRIAEPAEVLLGCARALGLLDLVLLVDHVLHIDKGSFPALGLAAAQRRRGAPLLRRALALADARSESPWESMLRVLHMTCDVPVEPQHVLVDESGDFVARGDLWLIGTRTLHEYDGGHHLTREAQRSDLKRTARLDRAGWTRRGYTKEDVLRQGVQILRDADLALDRPHQPERIREWHTMLRDSLHTPAGQARLRTRLNLPANNLPEGEMSE